MDKRISTITRKLVSGFLRPRQRDSHKGMFGTVAIIGGERGMVGAPLIAARAALKLGAGCVHVGLLAQKSPEVDTYQPELMLHDARDVVHTNRIDVLAIGCGMGTSIAARKILADVIDLNIPLVLDADALNLLAHHTDLQHDMRARRAATVITPHPGEAARLLGCTTAEVQATRTESARRLAQHLHCSVVLKGADSVCVDRDSKAWINKTGNPGMSSAGMGDALTGMIAALIAQGLEADRALLLAVHLHGAAADALAQQGICAGMTATEVIEWARWLLNQWSGQINLTGKLYK
jgi:ADP-dependent NAD(P)H-hydrate dehydratase / NAD(P)H-hydrate epimerase